MNVAQKSPPIDPSLREVTRYGIVAIVLHWLIALALAGELALGFAMPEAPAGFALWQFHKSLGIAILGLTIARLAWRLGHKPPASVETGLVAALARAAHLAFYALLLLAPLTGWAIVSTSATRIPTVLFGLVPFPHLPLPDALNPVAEQTHEALAWIALTLIALHIAGVVRHDLLLRHRSLGRMSPGGAAVSGGLLGLAVVVAGCATFLIVQRQESHASRHKVAEVGNAPNTSPEASRSAPPAVAAMEQTSTPEPTDSASAEPAGLPRWSILPGGKLTFSVANGGEVIDGRFTKWSGTIRFDPERPSQAEIAIKVALASATVGDATQDQMLAGDEYFSTAAFPSATVRISSARRTRGDNYVARGELGLKGVTRPQVIEFRLSGTGQKRHVEGSASIARAPFKLGMGETGGSLAPSVNVSFSFDAEAQPPTI